MRTLEEKFVILEANLQAKLRVAKQAYDELIAELDKVQEVLAMANAVDVDPANATDDAPRDDEAIDFAGAKNLLERLERIALHNGGSLHARTAARQIILAGVQGGTVNNTASSIYRVLDSRDDWIRERPGIYRWLRAGGSMYNDPQLNLNGEAEGNESPPWFILEENVPRSATALAGLIGSSAVRVVGD